MKIALYIRVSTEEQAKEGFSIAEQKERLRAFCIAHGWSDYEFYIDDGYSAKDTNRPAYQRILIDIRARRIQMIMTTKIDRLTRRLMDLLTFVDELDIYQCAYKSASETFDTSTAVGRMVLQLLGVFAEFERERIAERVRENMYHVAKQGKVVTTPCFGYDVADGQYVINKSEAEWILKMVDMILNGNGTWNVAKMLNENNVLTKRGREWTLKAVRIYLLKNEMLRGNTVWNQNYRKSGKLIQRPPSEWLLVENTHEPILDKDTYEKLQAILDQNQRVAPRSKNSDFLLSGIVYCGHCGNKMYGLNTTNKKNGKDYRSPIRYLCSGYTKKGQCFHHYIHTEILDEQVIQEVLGIGESDIAIPVSAVSVQANKLREELTQTKKQLSSMDDRFQRQIRAFEIGILDEADLLEAKQRLNQEKDEILAKIQALEITLQTEVSPEVVQEKIKNRISHLKSAIEERDQDRLKNIVRDIVHQVTVIDGSQIEISFSV
ncbi:recombinase family protein [Brevibacillus choshinensis]|uniref:recombinase family protein n=1 Tax=Brevibacillus choshinensis TaxID=54911 RepID=UPI002E1EC3A4|nr:recombinase family protein [Brevibacillus choshinensis]MED4749902.1 recombinase family protein [Brevibacillus choshinensis]